VTLPTPAQLHPRIRELEIKRNKLQAERTAKLAECAIIRARLQNAPSAGNAADNRVRAILGEAPVPETAPDKDWLDELLKDLHALNSAIGVLDHELYTQRNIGSRMVCDAIRPEVTKRAKVFAQALLDLHAANADYDRFIDEVENTGTNVASLNRIFMSHVGSPRDPCGAYYYSAREFVDAGIISRSDLPKEIR
jgi:hypothetical protein